MVVHQIFYKLFIDKHFELVLYIVWWHAKSYFN